jgi:hypothetical protein
MVLPVNPYSIPCESGFAELIFFKKKLTGVVEVHSKVSFKTRRGLLILKEKL